MIMCWELSSAKRFTSPSARACNHIGASTQGNRCKIWLVARRCCQIYEKSWRASWKKSDHRRNSTTRQGRQGNSPRMVKVMKTGGSITKLWLPQQQALRRWCKSDLKWNRYPCQLRWLRSNPVQVTSTESSIVGCAWRSHIFRRKSRFIWSQLRESFAAKRANNRKNLPPKQRKRFG